MITITQETTSGIPYVVFELVWIGIGFAFLAAAYKVKGEWVKASLGAMGLAIVGLRTLAVIPSWWLYYADAKLGWGGNGCTALDAQCLKQSVKDFIVVVENGAALGAFVLAFLIYQRKFPKQLAPGEEKPEPTFYR